MITKIFGKNFGERFFWGYTSPATKDLLPPSTGYTLRYPFRVQHRVPSYSLQHYAFIKLLKAISSIFELVASNGLLRQTKHGAATREFQSRSFLGSKTWQHEVLEIPPKRFEIDSET